MQSLHGCEVRACDLRAGAAMVIAAMCAEGTTLIEDAHFIERGYAVTRLVPTAVARQTVICGCMSVGKPG